MGGISTFFPKLEGLLREFVRGWNLRKHEVYFLSNEELIPKNHCFAG